MDSRILCATPTCEGEDPAILQVAGGRSRLDLSGDEKLNVSAWSYDRILKLARTIADLAGRDSIGVSGQGTARYTEVDGGMKMAI
jgi:hypothetical protein